MYALQRSVRHLLRLEHVLGLSAHDNFGLQLNLACLLVVHGQVAHAALILTLLSLLGRLALNEVRGLDIGCQLGAGHFLLSKTIINYKRHINSPFKQ